jgi:hypothetical protein
MRPVVPSLLTVLIALGLAAPAAAIDFLQTDAGGPGMAVQVNILRDGGGFAGFELISTSCPEIAVGPVTVHDRAADPANPVVGSVLSTMFFIDAGAADADCTVFVDGVALDPFNDGIDNLFSIVTPQPGPVDGGAGDADGAVDGIITAAASLRTDGGTVVLDSLTVADGEVLIFDTSDPLPASAGNEAFLPVILLVAGDASIEGTVQMGGEDGGDVAQVASDGGDGAPGGAGGGVGGNCYYAATAVPGDGFTGGGGQNPGNCTEYVDGGIGAAESNDSQHGGEGLFSTVDNGGVGYAGAAGGGTGAPWGTGGGGGEAYVIAGDGGFGGGGGAGHCDASYWGAGGGGFGTDGESGMGIVGDGPVDYRSGGAGFANGDDTLLPLAGGSGGAGGESGSGTGDGAGGGGGGGAFLLQAATITFGASGKIDAHGGNGGDTEGVNPGSSTGGAGGSGGGIQLVSPQILGLTVDSLDLTGGFGGHSGGATQYYSGDGGEGRLRVDGTEPPTLGAGPSGNVATAWQGAAITGVVDTEITTDSSGDCTLFVFDDAGGYVADVAITEDASEDIAGLLVGGIYLLVLVDDATGVMSAAGAWVLDYVPDLDGDGFGDETYGGTDCDDDDAAVYPGATELCDGVDNDCDGDVDEDDADDAPTWYEDGDGDGFGDIDSSAVACEAPPGFVANALDCDDGDGDVNPDADEVCDGTDNDCDGDVDEDDALDALTWFADGDGDGFGDPAVSEVDCDQPPDTVDNHGDCDDSDPLQFPGADEVCNGEDDDCDGDIDEDDALDALTWFADQDGDGFGSGDIIELDCDQPLGFVDNDLDCDDGDLAVNPAAEEICDGIDNDCDELTDELVDGDGDSFSICDGDCDDADPAVNPDAAEVCDGIDNDCDPATDEEVDGDGDGLSVCDDDCDDDHADVFPGNAEACDGIDNDCDGVVPADEIDDDGDGMTECEGDCDDADALTYDGAPEQCDGIDNDCDGVADEDVDEDLDGDGYNACQGDCDNNDPVVFPGATEICDGKDDDCDGDLPLDEADADGDGTMACEGDCDDDDAGLNLDDLDGDNWTTCDGDCDDDDAANFPGNDELCDGLDNDCDGAPAADELDEDGDGYMECDGDCDDSDGDVNPDEDEVCDGVDNDCDGATDDVDEDGDGFLGCDDDCDDADGAVYPGADEVCDDGIDNDCDELVDVDDEDDCEDTSGDDDDDTAGDDDDDDEIGGGCDCENNQAGTSPAPLAALAFGAAVLLTFRRRRH